MIGILTVFFGLEILARADFFQSIKVARIFWAVKKGIFWGIEFLSGSNQLQ